MKSFLINLSSKFKRGTFYPIGLIRAALKEQGMIDIRFIINSKCIVFTAKSISKAREAAKFVAFVCNLSPVRVMALA